MADGEIKVVFTAEDAAIQAKLAKLNAVIITANNKAAESSAKTNAAIEASLAKVQEAQAKASKEQSNAVAAQAKATKELLSLEEKRAQIAERTRQSVAASSAATARIADLAGKGRRDIREEARFMWASRTLTGEQEAESERQRLMGIRIQRKMQEAYSRQQLGPSITEAQRMSLLSAYRAPYSGKPPPKLEDAKTSMAGLSALSVSGVPYISTVAHALLSPMKGVAATAIGVGVALGMMRKAMNELAESAEKAAATYAKQLQSGGLPISFVARRETLAKVIGVGENEVFQFGSAVAYLNSKVATANDVFAKTNRTLTGMTWEFRVLQANMSALWAAIANAAAPAISGFIRVLNEMVDALTRIVSSPIFRVFAQSLIEAIAQVGFGTMANIMARVFGALGISARAPEANTGYNRLPTSSWEKMGLAINMGASSPAAATARNTQRTAEESAKSNSLLLNLIAAFNGFKLGLNNAP